jgi:hypothetical protein
MQEEVKEGVLLDMYIVKRDSPRVQSANPDEVVPSRNGFADFDLVLVYREAPRNG